MRVLVKRVLTEVTEGGYGVGGGSIDDIKFSLMFRFTIGDINVIIIQ